MHIYRVIQNNVVKVKEENRHAKRIKYNTKIWGQYIYPWPLD